MPNVHLQTAARDLQRAVSDLRQQEQQIRANTNHQKDEISQRLTELRTEETRLRFQANNSDDAQVKIASGARVTNIKTEIQELEKRIFQIEEETKRQLDSIERQALHVNDLSNELNTIA